MWQFVNPIPVVLEKKKKNSPISSDPTWSQNLEGRAPNRAFSTLFSISRIGTGCLLNIRPTKIYKRIQSYGHHHMNAIFEFWTGAESGRSSTEKLKDQTNLEATQIQINKSWLFSSFRFSSNRFFFRNRIK